VLTLLALEAAGEKPVLVAPDLPQDRTVDHLTGDAVPDERRGVLRESARLARGRIEPLSAVRPDDLEALIIPGGYGPVVNFSIGFARLQETRRIIPEVEAFVGHFLQSRKPVGLIGLGEVPARSLLGQELEMAPPPADPRLIAVDRQRRIAHTPGLAGFTRLRDVLAGIEAMVAEVLGMIEERGREESASRAGRDAR